MMHRVFISVDFNWDICTSQWNEGSLRGAPIFNHTGNIYSSLEASDHCASKILISVSESHETNRLMSAIYQANQFIHHVVYRREVIEHLNSINRRLGRLRAYFCMCSKMLIYEQFIELGLVICDQSWIRNFEKIVVITKRVVIRHIPGAQKQDFAIEEDDLIVHQTIRASIICQLNSGSLHNAHGIKLLTGR